MSRGNFALGEVIFKEAAGRGGAHSLNLRRKI
jgi:hypothetical protein